MDMWCITQQQTWNHKLIEREREKEREWELSVLVL